MLSPCWLRKVFSAMAVISSAAAAVADTTTTMRYILTQADNDTIHDYDIRWWALDSTTLQQTDDDEDSTSSSVRYYPCTQLYPSEPIFACVNSSNGAILPIEDLNVDAYHDRIEGDDDDRPTVTNTTKNNAASSSREDAPPRRRLDNHTIGGIAVGVIFGITLLLKMIQCRDDCIRQNVDKKEGQDEDDSTTEAVDDTSTTSSSRTTTADEQV